MIAPVPDTGVGPAPEPGRSDEVAPGIMRLTAPNPGLMTGPGTNTYVLGRGRLAVVDPGPDDATHRGAILDAAAPWGEITTVLVTHTHPDHAPGAAPLAAATGARVVGYGAAEGFAPDETARHGWRLSLAGPEGAPLSLQAVHTPGHASDHVCWLVPEAALLLTGDHVMHGSTVVIRPPDGDLHQYLHSLAAVRDADPPIALLAPGHGRLMGRVPEVIDALVAHRLARHEKVTVALAAAGDATPDELLPSVYADVTEAQLPVARFSLWAHLRALGQEGRAAPCDVDPGDEDVIETRWRALPQSP